MRIILLLVCSGITVVLAAVAGAGDSLSALRYVGAALVAVAAGWSVAQLWRAGALQQRIYALASASLAAGLILHLLAPVAWDSVGGAGAGGGGLWANGLLVLAPVLILAGLFVSGRRGLAVLIVVVAGVAFGSWPAMLQRSLMIDVEGLPDSVQLPFPPPDSLLPPPGEAPSESLEVNRLTTVDLTGRPTMREHLLVTPTGGTFEPTSVDFGGVVEVTAMDTSDVRRRFDRYALRRLSVEGEGPAAVDTVRQGWLVGTYRVTLDRVRLTARDPRFTDPTTRDAFEAYYGPRGTTTTTVLWGDAEEAEIRLVARSYALLGARDGGQVRHLPGGDELRITPGAFQFESVEYYALRRLRTPAVNSLLAPDSGFDVLVSAFGTVVWPIMLGLLGAFHRYVVELLVGLFKRDKKPKRRAGFRS